MTAQNIQNIKNAINIIDVIGHFERLRRKGRNYVCKCLFHKENTASFTVNKAKGIYKCFGCGASGDAIKFIQEHLKKDFIEAVKWLGEFYKIPIDETTKESQPRKPARSKPQVTQTPEPVYIPKDLFNASLHCYAENNFVKFLKTQFEPCIVEMLIEKYYIGSSKYYPGAVVFWQVDNCDNIRYGKIMGYDPETGKRIKGEFPQLTSVTRAIINNCTKAEISPPDWALQYDKQETKPQVLFGLHLISEDLGKPIAIVESEKTAIVASVFIPGFIWLATGGKGYEKHNNRGQINEVPELFRDKFKPLAGRNVVLFPDLGAVEDWRELAVKLSDIAPVTVDDYLEKLELAEKCDLCDFLTSDTARRELIDDYKNELIEQAPQTLPEGLAIWEQCRANGLMAKDLHQAHNEILRDYDFDGEGLLIGLKNKNIAA